MKFKLVLYMSKGCICIGNYMDIVHLILEYNYVNWFLLPGTYKCQRLPLKSSQGESKSLGESPPFIRENGVHRKWTESV